MSATRHRRPARSMSFRAAFGLPWLGVVAGAALLALRDRPADAEVKAGAWWLLVLFGIPGIVLALAAIRTAAVLGLTAVASGALSAVSSWGTMRDSSSTAAVGVVATPVIALVIIGVGCVVDIAWCAARTRFSSRAGAHDA